MTKHKRCCCVECENLELQNKRLLENNRALQAKLREGNRAILEEAIQGLTDLKEKGDPMAAKRLPDYLVEAWGIAYGAALDDAIKRLNYLLSFQQEPQETNI